MAMGEPAGMRDKSESRGFCIFAGIVFIVFLSLSMTFLGVSIGKEYCNCPITQSE